MDLSLDNDELETQEWTQALNSVIDAEGTERAHFLIEMMIDQARRSGSVSYTHLTLPTTPYV